jgi:hypothetical protein
MLLLIVTNLIDDDCACEHQDGILSTFHGYGILLFPFSHSLLDFTPPKIVWRSTSQSLKIECNKGFHNPHDGSRGMLKIQPPFTISITPD